MSTPATVSEAERGVISACLVNPSAASFAVEALAGIPAPFEDPDCATIFNEVRTVAGHGDPVDPVLVLDRLTANHSRANGDGGQAYPWGTVLAGLTGTGTSTHVQQYTRAVAEAARRREVEKLTADLAEGVRRGDEEATVAAFHGLESALAPKSTPEAVDVARWASDDPTAMRYVFDGVLPLDTIAGLTGQGGLGKGWLVQTIAVSLATGKPLLHVFDPIEAAPVLWLESEDTGEELHRRFSKMRGLYRLDETDLARMSENLHVFAGEHFPLVKEADGTVIPTEHLLWLRQQVQRIQPRLIVVDPLAHFHGGEENSNVHVAGFLNHLKDLAGLVADGASVLVVHHTSKQREDDLSSAMTRGASAFRDACRVLFGMAPLTKAEAEEYRVEGMPGAFVKLQAVKANWTARTGKTVFLRRDMSPEYGGVLQVVDLEGNRQEADAAVLDMAAKRLADLIGPNSENATCREILEKAQGDGIREILKDEFGRWATRANIRAAFEHAESSEYITVDSEAVGRGQGRKIPRKGA